MEQRLEKQTEEMTRAAKEMSEAARELRRAVDRLAEIQVLSTRGSALDELLGSGGLPGEEAAALAAEATHRVREEIRREREASETDEERLPPPTPEEIREWECRREERRRREGYYGPR
jgi:hypothetical protein